mmetsp:Transcript_13196/g.35229  ORF Transcript_13196/g.35229 Transcript_13196/m.35229 type:complete len:330 (+) Transcript_13196:1538-2527(+)
MVDGAQQRALKAGGTGPGDEHSLLPPRSVIQHAARPGMYVRFSLTRVPEEVGCALQAGKGAANVIHDVSERAYLSACGAGAVRLQLAHVDAQEAKVLGQAARGSLHGALHLLACLLGDGCGEPLQRIREAVRARAPRRVHDAREVRGVVHQHAIAKGVGLEQEEEHLHRLGGRGHLLGEGAREARHDVGTDAHKDLVEPVRLRELAVVLLLAGLGLVYARTDDDIITKARGKEVAQHEELAAAHRRAREADLERARVRAVHGRVRGGRRATLERAGDAEVLQRGEDAHIEIGPFSVVGDWLGQVLDGVGAAVLGPEEAVHVRGDHLVTA